MTADTEDRGELTQDEKREVLLNDLRVARERASTYHQFAADEADMPRGRFTTVEKVSVVGVSPPSYPPMPDNNPWRNDPVPPEPPLGIDVNEMQPTGEAFEVERSIAAQDAPTLGPVCLHSPAQAPPSTPDASSQLAPLVTDVERGVEGFSSGDPAAQSDFSKARR